MNTNFRNCTWILLSTIFINCSINAMDTNSSNPTKTGIETDTEIMSFSDVKDILESFGKTPNITNEQKRFITDLAECSQTINLSNFLFDMLLERKLQYKKYEEDFSDNKQNKPNEFKYYFFDYSWYTDKQLQNTFLTNDKILILLSYGTVLNLDFDKFLEACKVCYKENNINRSQYNRLLANLFYLQILARCQELENMLQKDISDNIFAGCNSIIDYYDRIKQYEELDDDDVRYISYNENSYKYLFLDGSELNNKFKPVLSSIIQDIIELGLSTNEVFPPIDDNQNFIKAKEELYGCFSEYVQDAITYFEKLCNRCYKETIAPTNHLGNQNSSSNTIIWEQNNIDSVSNEIFSSIEDIISNCVRKLEQRYSDFDTANRNIACLQLQNQPATQHGNRLFLTKELNNEVIMPYSLNTIKDYKPPIKHNQSNNTKEDKPNAFLEEID